MSIGALGARHARDIREWAHLSNAAFVPLRYHAHGRAFAGQMRNLSSPTNPLLWLSSNALTVERTDRAATTYGGHELLFMAQLGGTGSVLQQGRCAELAPGSAVLYDPRAPYTLEFPNDHHEIVVAKIDRRRLGVTAEQLQGATAVALEGQLPGHASLLGLLKGAARDSIALSATVGDLIVELLRPMVTSLGGSAPDPSADTDLTDTILSYARAHLADAALDSAKLAERHFISERKLYQLFEARGTTPAGWIRHARMELAQDLLSRSDASIAEVGREVGYPEATSFSRAFHREVGLSPTTYRTRAASRSSLVS